MAIEQCTCPLYHGIQMGRNILCPIHGDVRDTGFVIDSKDDHITAIEDAIEELDQEQERQARLIAAAPDMFRILKELLMPCPPEYAEAVEQRIKALIERVES